MSQRKLTRSYLMCVVVFCSNSAQAQNPEQSSAHNYCTLEGRVAAVIKIIDSVGKKLSDATMSYRTRSYPLVVKSCSIAGYCNIVSGSYKNPDWYAIPGTYDINVSKEGYLGKSLSIEVPSSGTQCNKPVAQFVTVDLQREK